MTPADLVEVRRIEELKYRYCRFLDQKEFDAVGELLAPDVTATYGGGAVALSGRAAVVEWLTTAMGSTDLHSSHVVAHPEIALVSAAAATGVWALRDVVLLTGAGLSIRGASVYEDRYVLVDGEWLISHTGYRRLYEEIGPTPEGTRLTASWFTSGGRSSLV